MREVTWNQKLSSANWYSTILWMILETMLTLVKNPQGKLTQSVFQKTPIMINSKDCATCPWGWGPARCNRTAPETPGWERGPQMSTWWLGLCPWGPIRLSPKGRNGCVLAPPVWGTGPDYGLRLSTKQQIRVTTLFGVLWNGCQKGPLWGINSLYLETSVLTWIITGRHETAFPIWTNQSISQQFVQNWNHIQP